tara:strand:+ start:4843 stop:5442 length:600 start_codon:yes stop_codon:yes gene_type:complete
MFRILICLSLTLIYSAFAGDVLQMAQDGHPPSQFEQGMREISSHSNQPSNWLFIAALQDHQQATHYLKKIARETSPIHKELLVVNPDNRLFINIYGPIAKVAKNDLNALRKKGNQGDIEAQYLMWKLYANDKGVSKAEAWPWLKQAAGNHHPRANFSLGLLYYYGYIVPEEKKRAYQLILKSSELGFNLATVFLKEYEK